MFLFLFPGQGSQQSGMGKFLFDNFPIAKETFEEASEAIKLDLKKLCFDGPDSDLAMTANTQPALLTVSTATQRVLQSEFNLPISATAGHSIGEYASFVLGGALPFASAVQAVRIRGEAMQSAVPVGKGGMLAVMGLDPEQVEKLCEHISSKGLGKVSPANYNCPGQIVISGELKALDYIRAEFKIETLFAEAKRVKFIALQVSAPFHCSLMAPAEEKMREVLTEMNIQDSKYKIIQNLTAAIEVNKTPLKENLIKQVSGSVKWMQSMDTAKKNNFKMAIECGHGQVLKGLLKKIDSEYFEVFSTNSLDDLKLIEEKRKAT